jgi:hypothetical protein
MKKEYCCCCKEEDVVELFYTFYSYDYYFSICFKCFNERGGYDFTIWPQAEELPSCLVCQDRSYDLVRDNENYCIRYFKSKSKEQLKYAHKKCVEENIRNPLTQK